MTHFTGKSDSARILVVDDEEMVREVLVEFLVAQGYRVDTAPGGTEALNLVEANPYDLILTDIRMPDKNGMAVLEGVRKKLTNTAVILMTGHSELDTAIEAMQMGAYDYISKPFNLDSLQVSVDRALEKVNLTRLNREYQNTLEHKVMEQSELIRSMFTDVVSSLTTAIEAKDQYTSGHSSRVTQLSEWLAGRLDLSREMKQNIVTAAQLHDIGKLGIVDRILNKPGKLTDEEYDLVKQHPLTSVRILEPIIHQPTLGFVRNHHERWDGRGYPDGLAGDQVPIGGRIIAVADAFDAMTSTRAYRPSMGWDKAIAEIERCSGTQFDPDLAAAFLPITEKDLGWE